MLTSPHPDASDEFRPSEPPPGSDEYPEIDNKDEQIKRLMALVNGFMQKCGRERKSAIQDTATNSRYSTDNEATAHNAHPKKKKTKQPKFANPEVTTDYVEYGRIIGRFLGMFTNVCNIIEYSTTTDCAMSDDEVEVDPDSLHNEKLAEGYQILWCKFPGFCKYLLKVTNKPAEHRAIESQLTFGIKSDTLLDPPLTNLKLKMCWEHAHPIFAKLLMPIDWLADDVTTQEILKGGQKNFPVGMPIEDPVWLAVLENALMGEVLLRVCVILSSERVLNLSQSAKCLFMGPVISVSETGRTEDRKVGRSEGWKPEGQKVGNRKVGKSTEDRPEREIGRRSYAEAKHVNYQLNKYGDNPDADGEVVKDNKMNPIQLVRPKQQWKPTQHLGQREGERDDTTAGDPGEGGAGGNGATTSGVGTGGGGREVAGGGCCRQGKKQQDADERLAESLQEEEQKAVEKAEAEQKEAERKEATRKVKAEEKWKRQEKMAKDAMEEVSAQLRAVEMKEIAVASRRQTLAEKDERVRDIFARAENQELTAEDLEELEAILRSESPDKSDVSDETNDEPDSEPDPNEVQTGKKQKRTSGKKSSAGKTPAKKPRESGDVEEGQRGRKSAKGNATGGDCVGTSPRTVRLVPKNDPNKTACWQCGAGKNKCDLVPGDGHPVNKPRKVPGGAQQQRTTKRTAGREPSEPPVAGPSRTRLGKRVEQLEEEMKTVCQSLVLERCFDGWLAAEFVRREPENKWPRVYLQTINWSPEGAIVTMPQCPGKGGHVQHNLHGMFISTRSTYSTVDLSHDNVTDKENSLAWESDSACDDNPDESEAEEYWGSLLPPMTWEERGEKCAAQREHAEKKCQAAEMRSAEHCLVGSMPKTKDVCVDTHIALKDRETVHQ
ncbi:hypothetical protein C8R45DRAFT_947186 [Mycena sanguinolenta]|nr:hypothetical protein C8R45DRAFT_947186 [Mycena sanguinolenta]